MKVLRNILVIPAGLLCWVICDWPLSWAIEWYIDLPFGWRLVALLTLGLVSGAYVGAMALLPMMVASSRAWGAWATACILLLLRASIASFLIGVPDTPRTYIVALILAALITIVVAVRRASIPIKTEMAEAP